MNAAEWLAFCQLLDATFTGELEPGGPAEGALRRYFERVPWSLAEAMVDRVALDGRVFMPKPGELMGALRRVVPDRTFGVSAALAGLTVAEYVAGRERPRVAGPRFDVLTVARRELAAGDES